LGTTPQFIRHLRIALGSTAELETHLEVASEIGLLAENDSTPALAEVERLISVLIRLRRRLGAQTPSP
jgi:four helix bundle protein